VLDDWVCEESSLLDGEDLEWELIDSPTLEVLTLDDNDELVLANAGDTLAIRKENQYNWDGAN
jgi:hypothetical protein